MTFNQSSFSFYVSVSIIALNQSCTPPITSQPQSTSNPTIQPNIRSVDAYTGVQECAQHEGVTELASESEHVFNGSDCAFVALHSWLLVTAQQTQCNSGLLLLLESIQRYYDDQAVDTEVVAGDQSRTADLSDLEYFSDFLAVEFVVSVAV